MKTSSLLCLDQRLTYTERTRNPHQTLADILLEVTPNPTAASRKAAKQDVVLRGGYLLRDLHKAVNEDALPKGNLRALFKPAMIQLFDALMDYLMLEGVYPGMSHGICDRKARVTKSALFHDGAPDCEEQENLELLEKIIYVIIVEIMVDKNPGIKGLIREQTLQDVIAAMADSAFTQSRMELGRQASGPVFAGVIDMSVVLASQRCSVMCSLFLQSYQIAASHALQDF